MGERGVVEMCPAPNAYLHVHAQGTEMRGVRQKQKHKVVSKAHLVVLVSLLSHSTSCARTILILFSKALSYSFIFSPTKYYPRCVDTNQPTLTLKTHIRSYAATTPWPCRILTSTTSLARPIFNKALAFDPGTVPVNDPNTSCGYVFNILLITITQIRYSLKYNLRSGLIIT